MLSSVQVLRQVRQPDDIILRRETLVLLHQSVEKLTELEQGIIKYILNDYKPSEIAHILNLNVKIVYNSIHRCKLKLKRVLSKSIMTKTVIDTYKMIFGLIESNSGRLTIDRDVMYSRLVL